MTSANLSPWARFSQDPRSPAAASLRASANDRNVALEVLARWAPKPTSPEHIQAKAVHTYEAARRNAISGMVIPSVITIVIWFAIGWNDGGFDPGFPWPLFVVLGTGVNLLRVLLHRQDMIEEDQQRLERKQRKELGGPKHGS